MITDSSTTGIFEGELVHNPHELIREEQREAWLREQEELKKKLVLEDTELWQKLKLIPSHNTDSDSDSSDAEESNVECQIALLQISDEGKDTADTKESELCNKVGSSINSDEYVDVLKYIGGVDISYVKENEEDACIAVVVICLPDLDVVYKDCQFVKVTAPYIPGFLAFREAELAKDAFDTLKAKCPDCFPQVILVDGNGILHPRGFGLACHLGVLLDIPCIGVAKNLYHTDGIERNDEYKQKISELKKAGDLFYLEGVEQGILGAALKTCDSATKPVYVSQGHRCSLETAIWVVKTCSKFRRPEPVRQADMLSREYLREREHNTNNVSSS